jgi:hypothetical protein
MESDDQTSSNQGIACWLEARPDGQLRLVMDDVERVDSSKPAGWRTKILFTWRDFDEALFLEGRLSEGELADIGLNVVSRLAALSQKLGRNRGG